MDTIKGRIMWSLFVAKIFIGMCILMIPSWFYWIITGKDLIEKFLKWVDEREDRYWERKLKSK